MKKLTALPEWQALKNHYEKIVAVPMADLFSTESNRFDHFSLTTADLFLDYSKNRITAETIQLLCQLAEKLDLRQQIDAMFAGALINSTEQRAALHTALRAPAPLLPDIQPILQKIAEFTKKVRTGIYKGYSGEAITDIVNIGIGGSDLGPLLATTALASYATSSLNLHFISSLDAAPVARLLKKIAPETTLFIISSKSFSTIETLTNAETIQKWFLQQTKNKAALTKHFFAVTAQINKAVEFGIAPANVFPIWDWVGGRFSVWSAIGLPVALAIGMDKFQELLNGAHTMDQHFRSAEFSKNIPVVLALLSIWYSNFFDAQTQAILSYDQSLQYLPNYIQQLSMESLGKNIDKNGDPVDYQTGQVIFGGMGNDCQHSFLQLLHQGTLLIPADFIVPLHGQHTYLHHQDALIANAFAQAQALMNGKIYPEANLTHKNLPGNRPSNTILFDKLTPFTLGALLALYEHKTFVQSVIWQINAFDQWGVEIGKKLAVDILAVLENKTPLDKAAFDSSTAGLIKRYKN